VELLDRYLQVVRFWLPRPEREDIAAELSQAVRGEIEEKEAELGRKLSDAEVEAILDRWGHPLRVAERYLPPRHLIGPTLFPVYAFVLKLVLLLYLMPWLLVWVGVMTLYPAYRTAHPGLAVLAPLQSWWLIALHAFAITTAGFALAERAYAKSGRLVSWEPRPAPPDPNRIPRSDSVIALATDLVTALWWLELPRFQIAFETEAGPVRAGLAPFWHIVYWPVLALLLGGAALAAVNLFRPYWTTLRAGVRLAIDGAFLVIAVLLLRLGTWIEVVVPGLPADKHLSLVRVLDMGVFVTLASVVVIVVVDAVPAARRILRRPALAARAGSAAARPAP
jgi:hypothetical protein